MHARRPIVLAWSGDLPRPQYLNDGFDGGETNWPVANFGALGEPSLNVRHVYRIRERFANCQTSAGLTVVPRRGSVALFYSLLPNSADKDWMAWHASCDVRSGEKWAVGVPRLPDSISPSPKAARGPCRPPPPTESLPTAPPTAPPTVPPRRRISGGIFSCCSSRPLLVMRRGRAPTLILRAQAGRPLASAPTTRPTCARAAANRVEYARPRPMGSMDHGGHRRTAIQHYTIT